MCVIFSCKKELPGEEYLEAAQDAHPDGIGVAWPSENKGLVRFQKGLEVKDLLKLYKEAKLPVNGTVIHFRKTSLGFGVERELCHPFPLVKGAPDNMFSGEVPGVLFQNGTWSTWTSHLKDGILCSGEKLDFRTTGFWSDARALAWLVERYGEMVLNDYTSTQAMRILTMLPGTDGEISRLYWGDWKDDEKGRWRLSNKEFSLPKAKSLGGGGIQVSLLPAGGKTSGKSSTHGAAFSGSKRGDQYWSDISEKWLDPDDWFTENERGTKPTTVKVSTPYTERELVELMCDLRNLRGKGPEGGETAATTSH